MQRLQLYLTDEQKRRISQRANETGRSQAEVVRAILDRGLGILRGPDERLAAVDVTAGLLRDHPDWPEWLRDVRGTDASDRLGSLGL